ncbi:UMP kinase [Candidatus Peregrinibacteria bacterium CG_4_10_14_0_2_um_filter_43_11]|nr:MAG: UMP kinase [Candidatus Peregrinibacteria bacterium CG_4_10_14_0_2_um_filter_43_11]
MKYKRIMLKISGEVLGERGEGSGIDSTALIKIAKEIVEIQKKKIQVVVVVGGGNIWRYRDTKDAGIERTTSDYMGMMATIMNSVALQSAIEKLGTDSRVATALDLPQIAEPYIRRRALRHLEKGRVVICGGGTGNPYFTTDTAAALRAVELECDVILKATKVDGVYTADPAKDKKAKKYDNLSYDEAIEKKLRVMDQTAFSLCRESKMKILVFSMHQKGAILKAATGEKIGTLVS